MSNKQTAVQETINLRRTELVKEIRDKVDSLFSLVEQTDTEEQKQSTEFAKNMCVSEMFRSVAYWENHLYEVSKTLQVNTNQENQTNEKKS